MFKKYNFFGIFLIAIYAIYLYNKYYNYNINKTNSFIFNKILYNLFTNLF